VSAGFAKGSVKRGGAAAGGGSRFVCAPADFIYQIPRYVKLVDRGKVTSEAHIIAKLVELEFVNQAGDRTPSFASI
jgi:hypothetical protein